MKYSTTNSQTNSSLYNLAFRFNLTTKLNSTKIIQHRVSTVSYRAAVVSSSEHSRSLSPSIVIGFVKARRVTYPLAGDAISRLMGPYNGSDGSGSGQDDDCLFHSDDIHGFFPEEDDDVGSSTTELASSSDYDGLESVRMDAVERLLRRCSGEFDDYKDLLASQVDRAMEVFSVTEPKKSDRRRKVVLLLQDIGHNAALCKTKWSSGRSTTDGRHEFIDVVGSSGERYIVELDFSGEFEIARPTRQYSRLMGSLPGVFVGKVEDMKVIVKAMTEAAKISMMSRGLSMPPWRKSGYMKNKWFGPYRRIMSPDVEVCSVNLVVKCRSVGFDDSSSSSSCS